MKGMNQSPFKKFPSEAEEEDQDCYYLEDPSQYELKLPDPNHSYNPSNSVPTDE